MTIAGFNTKVTTVIVPDPAGDATILLFKAPEVGATILNAYAACSTAIASHATNIITGSLLDGGADATGTTSMAAFGGANTAWAANEANAMTVTQDSVDGGDNVLFKYDEGGTVAPGYFVVTVEWTAGGS